MTGLISWNGQRSDQFGIMVEKFPDYSRPRRKFDSYTIPGRNGDLIMMQDAWENVEQRYSIAAGSGEQSSAPGYFSAIARWLCSPAGYCELWDDFDPGYFRLAYYDGPFDIESLADGRYGRAVIKFICMPQKFLISGKEAVEITAAAQIRNDTAYASKPLIKVERSAAGNGTVTVSGTIFTITNIPEAGLFIDCEAMNCYDTIGNNINNRVSSSSSQFASLKPGNNAIGFSGNVRRVIVTPRWFEI